MGRPVNKRFFGTLADGTNITINCQVAGNAESAVGMILSQRSVNKFNVDDSKTGGGNIGICTLVDKADGALGANEMSINAQDDQGGTIRISKLYNRTCKDFSNNRYTWEIEDDSTTSIMRVTAI